MNHFLDMVGDNSFWSCIAMELCPPALLLNRSPVPMASGVGLVIGCWSDQKPLKVIPIPIHLFPWAALAMVHHVFMARTVTLQILGI